MSMTLCTNSRMIYIVDGDPDLSLSAKCLFESRHAHVEICDDAAQFLNTHSLRIEDTVLIDLDPKKPSVFRLFNSLLTSHKRPNIVVTTPANAALNPSDIFPGERIEVLFHPIAPEALMKAVEMSA